MYIWNGFTIVGKRGDCTEALLITIEAAEEQLRNDPSELKNKTIVFLFKRDSTGFCP